MLEAIVVLCKDNSTHMSDRYCYVLADSVRLRQLLHNWLKNSLETTGVNSGVKLQTKCNEYFGQAYVELSVKDNGKGAGAVDKILEL